MANQTADDLRELARILAKDADEWMRMKQQPPTTYFGGQFKGYVDALNTHVLELERNDASASTVAGLRQIARDMARDAADWNRPSSQKPPPPQMFGTKLIAYQANLNALLSELTAAPPSRAARPAPAPARPSLSMGAVAPPTSSSSSPAQLVTAAQHEKDLEDVHTRIDSLKDWVTAQIAELRNAGGQGAPEPDPQIDVVHENAQRGI